MTLNIDESSAKIWNDIETPEESNDVMKKACFGGKKVSWKFVGPECIIITCMTINGILHYTDQSISCEDGCDKGLGAIKWLPMVLGGIYIGSKWSFQVAKIASNYFSTDADRPLQELDKIKVKKV